MEVVGNAKEAAEAAEPVDTLHLHVQRWEDDGGVAAPARDQGEDDDAGDHERDAGVGPTILKRAEDDRCWAGTMSR